MIFDIQKFCTKDGPGIRTTVFFKGCPLRCLWCHNPESQEGHLQQMYDAKLEHREPCGREYTAEEVLTEVLKDRLFYENSGGGLTLSGGEPLLQGDFCLELLQKAKEQGLHIAMETCGHASKERVQETAAYVDLYLFDYKETDPDRHREYTGVSNEQILENLRLLDSMGKEIILRCPLIPGFNDRQHHFERIAALAQSHPNIQKVQIEPYHSLGADKYRRLGRTYSLEGMENPEKSQVDRWIESIQSNTDKPIERA